MFFSLICLLVLLALFKHLAFMMGFIGSAWSGEACGFHQGNPGLWIVEKKGLRQSVMVESMHSNTFEGNTRGLVVPSWTRISSRSA